MKRPAPWQSSVVRVQGFAGSLQGCRARKGIFTTTAAFNAEAGEYLERIDTRVVLIHSTMLARLMIEHNFGVHDGVLPDRADRF